MLVLSNRSAAETSTITTCVYDRTPTFGATRSAVLGTLFLERIVLAIFAYLLLLLLVRTACTLFFRVVRGAGKNFRVPIRSDGMVFAPILMVIRWDGMESYMT